ncbi:MAG: hypothetical protein NZL98_07025, partial [Anaerolineales bacterium]|nr:hypothetical protein [Anaerolineales bacterium]
MHIVNITSTLRICTFFLVAMFLLSCTTTQQEAGTVLTPSPAFTQSFTGTPSSTPVTLSTLTSAPISPFPVIRNRPGDLYETVFTIPVGEEGVTYQGVGIPDMAITGPNALAILPDGSFVIADLVGNRLLRYDSAGQLLRTIELETIGIINVSDLRASKTELVLLEISFEDSPTRYRVNRLTFDGRLIAGY